LPNSSIAYDSASGSSLTESLALMQPAPRFSGTEWVPYAQVEVSNSLELYFNFSVIPYLKKLFRNSEALHCSIEV
jgi:hypothetical protein